MSHNTFDNIFTENPDLSYGNLLPDSLDREDKTQDQFGWPSREHYHHNQHQQHQHQQQQQQQHHRHHHHPLATAYDAGVYWQLPETKNDDYENPEIGPIPNGTIQPATDETISTLFLSPFAIAPDQGSAGIDNNASGGKINGHGHGHSHGNGTSVLPSSGLKRTPRTIFPALDDADDDLSATEPSDGSGFAAVRRASHFEGIASPSLVLVDEGLYFFPPDATPDQTCATEMEHMGIGDQVGGGHGSGHGTGGEPIGVHPQQFAAIRAAKVGHRRHSIGSECLQSYVCASEACDKTFTHLKRLQEHFKIHLGERPYKCKTCVMSFTRSHDLRRHERIHSGDRPYVCDACTKSFSRNDALSRHRRLSNCVGKSHLCAPPEPDE